MNIESISTVAEGWTAELKEFLNNLDLSAVATLLGHSDTSLIRTKIEALDVFLVDDLPFRAGSRDWLEEARQNVLDRLSRRATASDRCSGRGDLEPGGAPCSLPHRLDDGTVFELYGLYTPALESLLAAEPDLRNAFQRTAPPRDFSGPAVLVSPLRITTIQTELLSKLQARVPWQPIPSVLRADCTMSFARLVLLHEIGHHVLPARGTRLSEALASLFADVCSLEDDRLLHCLLAWYVIPYVYSGYQLLQHGREHVPLLSSTLRQAFNSEASRININVGKAFDEEAVRRGIDFTFGHIHTRGGPPTVFLSFVGLFDGGKPFSVSTTPVSGGASRTAQFSVAGRILGHRHGGAADFQSAVEGVLEEIFRHETWMRECRQEAATFRGRVAASPGDEQKPWRDGDATTIAERIKYLEGVSEELLPPADLNDVKRRCREAIGLGAAILSLDSTSAMEYEAALSDPECGYSTAKTSVACLVAGARSPADVVPTLVGLLSSPSETARLAIICTLDDDWECRAGLVAKNLLGNVLPKLEREFEASVSSSIRVAVLNLLATLYKNDDQTCAREALQRLRCGFTPEEDARVRTLFSIKGLEKPPLE